MPRTFRIGSLARWMALSALLVMAWVAPAGAQTTSASVTGTVEDASKAVMPGVTVTLTSKSQGDSQTAVTDGEGRYVFSVVRPDSYILKVTLDGFKTTELTNFVVNASDKIAVPALTLEVGSLEESISVSARITELQAQSGERSFAMESTTLQNVANNGRSMFNYASMVPGVLGNGVSGAEMTQVNSMTVNGARPESNNMTIDGVANIDTGNNGGNMATTNIDSVAEFKILTNAYQAEYGRAVGGQVQVVTKSGTQEFHGSGYWYGRRSGWNATSWLNNRDGLATPKSSRNDQGYTLGGPINKKRLFFFFSQEHQRRNDPAAERRATVPTALERQGDFSQSVDSAGNPYPYIRDYTLNLPCSAADTRGCFADGGVLGRIPANRLYALGLNFLKLFPNPNGSYGSGQNYSSQLPNKSPRREDLIRLDYQITDSWRMTGRFMHTEENILNAYGSSGFGAGSDQVPMPSTFARPGANMMLSTQKTLTNTMSFEASVGHARNSIDLIPETDTFLRAATGLSNFPYLYPDANYQDFIPYAQFRGGRTSNAAQIRTELGPFTNKNQTWDVVASLTKVWGPHTAKAGIYYQHSYKPQSIFAPFNSSVSFINDSNNTYDTGYALANAAIGVFNTYSQASAFSMPDWTYNEFEWYLQDNWKTGRLTLDYGVRFYYMQPQYDTSLKASNFLPDSFNASAAANLYAPVCLTANPCTGGDRRGMNPALIASGVAPTLANTVEGRFIGRLVAGANRFNGLYAAGNGITDTLQDGSELKVSPRLGVVYDVSGKGTTIVRGGWALMYDRPQGNMVFDMGGNAPSVLTSSIQYGRLQDISSNSTAVDPFPTLTLNPTAYDFKAPKVQQWNVGVQQKLPHNMVFDISYVGSKSTGLLRQWPLNAVPIGAAFLASNQDPTRVGTSTVPGATALPNDFLRPYRGYSTIRMWDYSGWSDYQGFQTSLTRRFDKNYMFSVFYVYSKTMSTNDQDTVASTTPTNDPDVVRDYDYSYAGFHRPHNFVTNFIYRTPKVTENRAVGIFTNDWQISGVYRWTSGRPYAITYSVVGLTSINITGSDQVTPRALLTCDPGSGYSGDAYKQFNTSCFAPAQVGSNGNESERYYMTLPPINSVDMSLSKTFPLYKQTKFELRIDAFNALNHTQFTSVNNNAIFSGLTNPTITNLPYNASGQLVNKSGFGTISGVANPRTIQVVARFTF